MFLIYIEAETLLYLLYVRQCRDYPFLLTWIGVQLLLIQVALDKTAEQFRSAQVEREEMISQWETTLQQMSRRDKQIDDVSLVR